jgi:hypothetical protein
MNASPQSHLSPFVEILSGRTRHPRRPMSGDRFLIGAGTNCDLQLSGPGIPILHSILHRDEDSLRIEAIVPQPPLVVSGSTVREALLSDGAVVHIGEFSLAIRTGSLASEDLLAPLDVEALVAQHGREAQEAAAVARMSALELVNRLEVELKSASGEALRRRAGLVALLDAALRASQGNSTRDELARLVAQLDLVASEIEARTRMLRRQEQEFTAQAEASLAAHEQLLATLEAAEAGPVVEEVTPRLRLSA